MYLLSSRKLKNSTSMWIRAFPKSFKDNLKCIFWQKKTAIHEIKYVKREQRV